MTFTTVPADIAPADSGQAPTTSRSWDLTGLDPIAQRFERNYNKRRLDARGPRADLGDLGGDNWRVGSNFTVNYGVRWDVDLERGRHADTSRTSIPIDNGSAVATTDIPEMEAGDFGYRDDIRDLTTSRRAAGFTWNIGGKNDFVIRGGTGLYFGAAADAGHLTARKLFSRMITASFDNDGLPNFVEDPTRGVDTYDEAQAKAPPQAARIIESRISQRLHLAEQHRLPEAARIGDRPRNRPGPLPDGTTTSGPSTRTSPTTRPPATTGPAAAGRPNPQCGSIVYFVSTGKQDYTVLATGSTAGCSTACRAG